MLVIHTMLAALNTSTIMRIFTERNSGSYTLDDILNAIVFVIALEYIVACVKELVRRSKC